MRKDGFWIKNWEKLAAFAFGTVFIVVLLVIAFLVPTPTATQWFVFRVVLALAAAGIGVIIPGLIVVRVSKFIRAGGAIALFVLVYWFNPPKLVVSGVPVKPELPAIDATPRSLNNLKPGYITGIGMTFKNAGTGTAYSTTSDVSVGVLPFPLPHDYPMPEQSKTHLSVGTLVPGAEVDGFGQMDKPLTLKQFQAIVDGSKMRLYVAGTFRYRLASGQQCARHFLWQTGGPQLVSSIAAWESSQPVSPPWWAGDRYNDVTPPECE